MRFTALKPTQALLKPTQDHHNKRIYRRKPPTTGEKGSPRDATTSGTALVTPGSFARRAWRSRDTAKPTGVPRAGDTRHTNHLYGRLAHVQLLIILDSTSEKRCITTIGSISTYDFLAAIIINLPTVTNLPTHLYGRLSQVQLLIMLESTTGKTYEYHSFIIPRHHHPS